MRYREEKDKKLKSFSDVSDNIKYFNLWSFIFGRQGGSKKKYVKKYWLKIFLI